MEPKYMSNRDSLSPYSDIDITVGNDLYQKTYAVFVGSGEKAEPILGAVMRLIGATPEELNIEELAAMLPELERRLRNALPAGESQETTKKLQRLVISWEP
jgi:hypothetical protein